jgi:hypothetical protein
MRSGAPPAPESAPARFGAVWALRSAATAPEMRMLRPGEPERGAATALQSGCSPERRQWRSRERGLVVSFVMSPPVSPFF